MSLQVLIISYAALGALPPLPSVSEAERRTPAPPTETKLSILPEISQVPIEISSQSAGNCAELSPRVQTVVEDVVRFDNSLDGPFDLRRPLLNILRFDASRPQLRLLNPRAWTGCLLQIPRPSERDAGLELRLRRMPS